MERTEGKLAPIQGIAFDLEGTIVDLERLHHTAHLKAAAEVGLHLSWEEALNRLPHFVGGPDEAVAAEIAELVSNNSLTGRILRAKRDCFERLLVEEGNIVPREGFCEFARWVKDCGLEISIGTVTDGALAWLLLRQSGIVEIFDSGAVVVREDVARPKPAPDVYLETARRMGIPCEAQLVFEDSLIGLRSARAADCRAAIVPTIHTVEFSQALFLAGADAVFHSWDISLMRPFVLGLMNK